MRTTNHRIGYMALPMALVVAVGLAVPMTARAQSDMDPLVPQKRSIGNFGIHGGFVKVRDAQDSDFQGGAHLEFNPARWLGIQGAVDYRSEERMDIESGPLNAEVDVRTLPLTLSGKLYLPVAPKFMPYGLAGAGWYHQKIDFSEDLENVGFQDRTDTNFGWHLGLGATVEVSPRVALFGEGRWIFLDPDRDLNEATVDQIEDFDFNSSHILAGVSFLF